tara:strand:+ start:97 stop:426 length:330 start_codon:yes stop_codon:yes gene_type:complete
MMPKYPGEAQGRLSSDLYFDVLERKGRKFLKIRRTVVFDSLQGMEIGVLEEHVWSREDKLHKLSLKFYGSTRYWWIIGLLNKKPTDGHYEIGDIVYIPSKPSLIEGAIK